MAAQTPSVNRKRGIAMLFAPIIAVSVGVLALLGWLLDSAVLKSVLPGLTAMNPMTAVAFILGGIALWLAPKPRFGSWSRFIALIVFVIALLKLIEVVFGWNIGIDRILFADRLQAESVPNRMAPNTATDFLFLGAALFLINRRSSVRGSNAAQALTLIAALIAVLAVIGYLYDARTFYGVLTYIPMALNTAVTFLVLCIGIMSAQPEVGVMALWRSQTTGGELARRAIPAAALVLVIMGGLELMGEHVGVFDDQLGKALFTIVNILLMCGGVWWTAQAMDRGDRERRRSAAALSESETRYRTLFENSSDAILVLDGEGRYVDGNSALERLTGYSRAELLQMRVPDLTPASQAEYAGERFTRAISQGFWSSEDVLLRKDGSEILVELKAVTIAPGIYQAILHDIQERKQTEENLRLSLEQERQLNELKSRFVSMVSHEFRTPLAVIRSSTDLLLHYGERTTPERRTERLEKIQNEVSLMVQLLDDILIIRKLEDAGVTLQPELFDLREFCTSLIAEIQPVAPSHRIEFTSGGDCTEVSADPKLLRQVITNLISNAIKYSPERESIQLDLICAEKETILHVRDEGIGIPEEDQAHLFEVFHRASNVGSISGTGLGLPIVKQAVEAHGGTVEVASEVNVGTTFTVSLPRTVNL